MLAYLGFVDYFLALIKEVFNAYFTEGLINIAWCEVWNWFCWINFLHMNYSQKRGEILRINQRNLAKCNEEDYNENNLVIRISNFFLLLSS